MVCYRNMTKIIIVFLIIIYRNKYLYQECNKLPHQKVKRFGHCHLRFPVSRSDTHTMRGSQDLTIIFWRKQGGMVISMLVVL